MQEGNKSLGYTKYCIIVLFGQEIILSPVVYIIVDFKKL